MNYWVNPVLGDEGLDCKNEKYGCLEGELQDLGMHLEVPRRENMEEKALILRLRKGSVEQWGRQEN